jgi:hypothetical protein
MSKANNVFKPTVSQLKGDATTRAAREIIDAGQAANHAKTERLRAARLAKEAAVQTAAQLHVEEALSSQPGTKAQKAKRSDRLRQLPQGLGVAGAR